MKTPEERSKANEARGQCASCSPIIARRCRTLRTVEECLDYIDTLERQVKRAGLRELTQMTEDFGGYDAEPHAPSAEPRRCAECDQLVLECMGSTLPRDFVAAIDGRVSAQLIRELCASCAERLGPSMVAGTDSLGEFSGPVERIVRSAEPASTARERLGRYLAAKPNRGPWTLDDVTIDDGSWRKMVLVFQATERGEKSRVKGLGATEDEAIAAALDQLTAAESAGKAET